LTRFSYDAPLIAAFMDRWWPETHMFHFPVGEMTLSLEDATTGRSDPDGRRSDTGCFRLVADSHGMPNLP
jgi:hypothetical protein